MTKRQFVGAFLLLLSSAASTFAQSQPEATRTLADMQRQIDRLQALVATRTGLPDPALHVWIDTPTRISPNIMLVWGWGFDCAHGRTGDLFLRIDGVVSPALIGRFNRVDVRDWAIQNGVCPAAHVPLANGGYSFVDVTNYSDGQHFLQFEIRNDVGIALVSNLQLFTIDHSEGSKPPIR